MTISAITFYDPWSVVQGLPRSDGYSISLSLPVSISYNIPTTVGAFPAKSGSSLIMATSSLMLASMLMTDNLCQLGWRQVGCGVVGELVLLTR